MERRVEQRRDEEEDDFNGFLRGIPSTRSTFNNDQYCLRQPTQPTQPTQPMLFGNNNVNTINDSFPLYSDTRNSFGLVESRFNRLTINPSEQYDFGSIPSPSTHQSEQSQFCSPVFPPINGNASGVSLLPNSFPGDTFLGQGFSSLPHQQRQTQVEYELLCLRAENELLRRSAGTYTASGVNPISIRDEPSSQFLHSSRDLVSCCGKSYCRSQPSISGTLQLPKPCYRDYTNRSSTIPLCNGNGFRLDSDGNCRLASPDINALRSRLSNQSLEPRQQFPSYLALKDFRGQMVQLAKDEKGGRFLQEKLSEGKLEDIEIIFAEVKGHLDELFIHLSGNLLVQNLLDFCTEEQKMEIVHAITREPSQLAKICLNDYGTRAVQKLVEKLETSRQISPVVSALNPDILKLVYNKNGQHVIRHCLKFFPCEYTQFLVMSITEHCVVIAKDNNGCCAMQNCLKYAQGEQKEKLLDKIIENALVLAQDPYGNYVVQCILDLKIPRFVDALLKQLEGSYAYLSLQKCSSHVVEKCLQYSEVNQSTRIISELINCSSFDSLLEDAYGNYVVQSALLVAQLDTYDALVGQIRKRAPSLRNHPFGKKILDKIDGKRRNSIFRHAQCGGS